MEFIVATGNPGKRREFEVLLEGLLPDETEVYDLGSWKEEIPEVVEDRETFEGNAVKKALEVSQFTGVCALADDSGLAVDALDGRPGVYSARYSGPNATDEENNHRLVRELQRVPEEERTARYVAVVCIALADDPLGRSFLERRRLAFDDVREASRPDDVPDATLRRIDDRVVTWFRGTCEGRIIDEARGDGGFGYDPHFLIPDWGETMAEVSLEKKNRRSHRARAIRKLLEFFGL